MEERKKLEIKRLMTELRATFARGDWGETLDTYEQTREIFKGERALRLEAACLAARAWIGQKDRAKARATLKPVAGVEYKKAAHYEHLAKAFLDLKQYDDAAKVCAKAHILRQAEIKK